MQVFGLTARVLFYLTVAFGQFVINASLAEHLGFAYDKSLDFSSSWSGLQQEQLQNLNDIRIDIDDSIETIAHNILLSIYGGKYDDIYTHDLNSTLTQVFDSLAPKHEKFRDVPELVAISKGAQLVKGQSSSWTNAFSTYGFKRGEPERNTRCVLPNGGYCFSWKGTNARILPFYQSEWLECTWQCVTNPNVKVESLEQYPLSGPVDYCFYDKPKDCN